MWGRLKMTWVMVRDSLWLIPALFTLVGAALAVLLVSLEQYGVLGFGRPDHWLLGGGAEGARGVLSSIAGGLITVTGVVFSVTIVALQLASSQFTPRVLRNFTADRSNQLVLGVFIGTFTYALLVLRMVREGVEDDGAFVPRVAVFAAVILVLISIGFLIYFIHHAARSIQIPVILERVTRLTLHHVEQVFPETIDDGEDVPAEPPRPPERGETKTILARSAGYLQAVDTRSLAELGEKERVAVRMERRIGAFVYPGQALVTVYPGDAVDDEAEEAIRRGLVQGSERTPEQDAEFGILEICDIAVKALSPSINDPTTAFHCLDRLGQILLAIGRRYTPADARTLDGEVCFIPVRLEFERAVGLAFDPVAHFGASNPAVVTKLLDVIGALTELVPPSRRPPLLRQRDKVLELARGQIENAVELTGIEEMARRTRFASIRESLGDGQRAPEPRGSPAGEEP